MAARVSDQQANLVKCQEDVLKAQMKLSRLLDEPLPSDEAERNATEIAFGAPRLMRNAPNGRSAAIRRRSNPLLGR